MSENTNSEENSKSNSNSGCGIWSVIFVLLIALFFCNKCISPVIGDTEVLDNSEFVQLVFLDDENAIIDGKEICPAIRCKRGGFLSKHTQMTYSIEGADSNLVISDAFAKVGFSDYMFTGKLMNDITFVPIISLSDIKGGETLDIRLVENGYTRINTRSATVHNKFYVVPRGEDQPFENWIDSCRMHALNDVNVSLFRAVFVSEDRVSRGIYIGDYSSFDECKWREEFIAQLNKDAYKERNYTSLKIDDVDIAYHCEDAAANVTVTFEPVVDTLKCRFVYQLIEDIGSWSPRSKDNTRFGYHSTYIIPGQTEYEFNVCPERIAKDFNDPHVPESMMGVSASGHILDRSCYTPKIADLALIGIIDGDSLKNNYLNTYDHRSSFWQKITLKRDLSPARWKLILAIVLGIVAYICLDSAVYNSDRAQKIALIILCVIISLIIIYGIMWGILSSF